MKCNEEKGKEVFEILENLWKEKESGSGIFKDIILPQNRWETPKDDKEHASWLFYAALPMRGGLVTEEPFKWLKALRDESPEMFSPEMVVKKLNPSLIKEKFSRITAVLNGNGAGETKTGALSFKADEYARNWYENSVILNRWWGGDVRNVFGGVGEFEEAFRRVDYYRSKAGFKGMRRKIFSLLVIWLQEKKLIPLFPGPIPIDFHAFRILWQTEILNLHSKEKPFLPRSYHPEQLKGKTAVRVSETLMDSVAKWSQKFICENNFSHLNINPAIWVLSRSLCAGHFQASSRQNKTLFVDQEELLGNFGLWPKKYEDRCGYCPIEKWCRWIVPSGPYYGSALLVKIGERIPFPIMRLPGVEKDCKILKNGRGRL